ncbi:putative metal-dependent hydrolase [Luteitalea sp. TBR-22]|uniref:YfiT family bacillithiol transferase n=1 Tax=Luteitalea sp. TBR-22 TaxID=2802971 RepID=UPI001AF12050|nr:putative metal-dependent hydrolase [Luteitalea sp. TBR-22]BCS31256.1 putative metal-dependent hydrolase [Luteitalea sp. TBR-22]
MSDALRYPVGRFVFDESGDTSVRRDAISTIRQFPQTLRAAAASLSEAQLATPYREGGWTARQVIHHVADSHVNAYVRTRWLLTEDRPDLKAYDEKAWAELPDAALTPIEPSLALVEALHQRWATLLEALPDEAFAREIVHPERGPMTLDKLVQMYAWHGRHHVAHLQIVAGTQA